MVMQDGAIAYARDGHVHKHGFLGGGLVDAVRGVPEAERAARTFRSRMGWGLAGVFGGLVCSTVALAYSADASYENNNSQAEKASLTSLACLGLTVVGGGIAISGAPYQHDAINIFNDSVQPVGPVYLPGQAPGVVPPAAPRY
jgi:hypothetical protein